jgi:hypothetical protein
MAGAGATAQVPPSPGASPSPVGSGSLQIYRYVCNAEDESRLEIFAPGADPVFDDLDGLDCVPTAGDFILVSDFGRTTESFEVGSTGEALITDLAATDPGGDEHRLIDSGSTGNGYIRIAPGQTTVVISYAYEFVFVMPTPPSIPTIDLDDDPPPPPDITAGAGTGPDDDPDDFDVDELDEEVDDDGGADSGGFVDQTGASKPIVDTDKRTGQVAFLLLAIAGFVGFQIYKRRKPERQVAALPQAKNKRKRKR